MKITITHFVLILFISGCSNFRKTPDDSSLKISFEELEYGICETKTVHNEKMGISPSDNHILSTGFNLIEQTTLIPSKIGQKFGAKYIIKSNITKDILVEQVWLFPKTITDDNGKEFKELRYQSEKSTNDTTYSVYSLEKDYELVKGEWIYQLYYSGEKVYERKYYLE